MKKSWSAVFLLLSTIALLYLPAISFAEVPQPVASGWVNNGSINSLGEVVWSQRDDTTYADEVFSSTRGKLSSDNHQHALPAVNSLGDMVWWESDPNVYPPVVLLRGVIGGRQVTLAKTQYGGGLADLNDRGEVIWAQQDDAGYDQLYSNVRGQLTSGNLSHRNASINNNGDIVFEQYDPAQSASPQIYKLAAGSSSAVAITSGDVSHGTPAITDSGEVVWSAPASNDPYSMSVFSSVRGEIPVAASYIMSLDINNCGDLAYSSYEGLLRYGTNAPCATFPATSGSQSDATAVTAGSIFTGVIDAAAAPVQWYRFDAAAGEKISVTVNYDKRAPNSMEIGLYDGNGTLVSGATSASPFGIVTPGTYTGTYYLKAAGSGGRFGYAVSIRKETAGCSTAPCPELLATGVSSVKINSLGEVVWSQHDPVSDADQLFSSTRGQLTFDFANYSAPAHNNFGDLVWVRYTPPSASYYSPNYSILGKIKGTDVGLQSSTRRTGGLDMNDRGEVIWVQEDPSGFQQLHSSLRGLLTTGNVNHYSPSMNNNGDIIFVQADPAVGGGAQVYKLAAGTSTAVQLTGDSLDYKAAAINDGGELVWGVRDPANGANKLVSSVRGELPVTLAGEVAGVDINSCGDVVYSVNDNGTLKLYRLGSQAPCVSSGLDNNWQGAATPVALGDIFSSVIDGTGNPVDWYRFDAAAGQKIHIKVNYDNQPPVLLTLGLYDGQGSLLSAPTSYNPLAIDTTAGYTGTYYIKLQGSGPRSGYSLSLSQYTDNCGVGPCSELLAENVSFGSINSLGEVLWAQYDENLRVQEIFSSERGQLTFDMVWHDQVVGNNLGDMVWLEYDTLRGIIAGQQVTLSTGSHILSFDINDLGEVIWAQQTPSGDKNEIRSNVRGLITSITGSIMSVSVNNNGDIAFGAIDYDVPGRIYKVPAGATTPVAVTNDALVNRYPAINDSGEIIWAVIDMSDAGKPISRFSSSVRGMLPYSVPAEVSYVDANNCGDILYLSRAQYYYTPANLYRLGQNAPCMAAGTARSFVMGVAKSAMSTGTGQVVSYPDGISLTSTDSLKMASFPANSLVLLNASADPGYYFAGWGGACSGNGVCQVSMNLARSVTAAFKPLGAAPTVAITSPVAGLTNNNRPVLQYALSDGTAVVKVDGVVVNKAAGDTLDALADGTHTVRIESTDLAREVGAAEVTFTVDTLAPAVAISTPVDGFTTSNPANLLSYTVSDGTVVVKVNYTVVSKTSGDLLDLPEGTNTIRVEATDQAGNTGVAQVQVKVDTIAPAVSIVSPVVGLSTNNSPSLYYQVTENALIKVLVDGVVVNKVRGDLLDTLADGSHTVRIEATDDAGNTGFKEVTFTVDTTAPVVTISSPTAGSIPVQAPLLSYSAGDGSAVVKVDGVVVSKVSGETLDTLANGTHTVAVESTDAAGNSAAASVTFTVDTVAPVVAITSPAAGLTKNNRPAINYTVSEGSVVVKVDGVAVNKDPGQALDTLADGNHTIRVESTDAAGNVGSAEVTLTVDTVAPVVTISSPGTRSTRNRTPLLSYSVAEGNVVVKVDGIVVNKVSGDTLDPLADGQHTVLVESTDAAGNTGSTMVTFTVDNVAPVVAISSPAAGLTKNNRPVLTYTVNEGLVGVRVDGVPVNKVSGEALDTLADGSHTVDVEATDAAGNIGTAHVYFTVDTVAPVVTISSPTTGITHDQTPLLTYSAGDGSVVVKVDGVVVSKVSGSSLDPLADGTHTVVVASTDAAGNTAVASVTFTYQFSPVAVTTASLPAAYVSEAFSQTLNATGGVAPYNWAIVSGALPAGLTLNPSTGLISGVPSAVGTSSFTVQATDTVQTTALQSLSITVNPARPDLVVPAGSVTGPTAATRGKKITLSATVKNQGTGTAAGSTLTFYLSSDSTITTADVKLADATITSLASGASQTVNVSAVVPSTIAAGSYYIAAIADRPGVVAESVETNNATIGNTISLR